MKKPEPLRPEQLAPDYQQPNRIDGERTLHEGGVLSTKPSFTTSAKAQEKSREKRETKGHYFGARVRTVTAEASPKPAPSKPVVRGPVQPVPDGHRFQSAGRRSAAEPNSVETRIRNQSKDGGVSRLSSGRGRR